MIRCYLWTSSSNVSLPETVFFPLFIFVTKPSSDDSFRLCEVYKLIHSVQEETKVNPIPGHKRQISIMSWNLSGTDPSSFANETAISILESELNLQDSLSKLSFIFWDCICLKLDWRVLGNLVWDKFIKIKSALKICSLHLLGLFICKDPGETTYHNSVL